MQKTAADTAFEAMNALGKNRVPFLFILDFELQKPVVLPLSDITENTGILFNINGLSNFSESLEHRNLLEKKSFFFKKYPQEYAVYAKKFEQVLQNICWGNSFLVNLTQETPIETDLTLKEIFVQSTAKYRLLFENEDTKFVVFSPEIFVKIDENGIISSNPMKGTIDASIENAEKKLLDDPKEKAEHYTIVDLIRNDLSSVATGVRVAKFRYIEKVVTHSKALLQASSRIEGQLSSDFRDKLGDIFRKLLPAGSISGAPKPKTVQIIKDTEGYERGYYTGVFGVFDGKKLDSGVMIRFIEQKKNGSFVFKSGGGITFMSDVPSEYAELIDKVYVPIIARNPAL